MPEQVDRLRDGVADSLQFALQFAPEVVLQIASSSGSTEPPLKKLLHRKLESCESSIPRRTPTAVPRVIWLTTSSRTCPQGKLGDVLRGAIAA
eukprot:5792284-Amphidinium_carterae.1